MPQVNPIIKKGLQEKAIALRLEGKSTTEIIKELGVTIGTYYAWRRKIRDAIKTDSPSTYETVKSAVRLEINQENAITELSKQMAEYTELFEDAMKREDEKAAYGWSQNRIALLEKMLKVTGIYDRANITQGETKRLIIVEE